MSGKQAADDASRAHAEPHAPRSAPPADPVPAPERRKPGQLDSRPVHSGRVVDLAVDTVRFPDGSTGQLELIRHSGASAVLPVLGDPDGPDPDVLLIRQFRYAAGGELLEVPAGRPDRPGEPWQECARRELEEETGRTAGRLEYLGAVWTTPGFTDERIHLFLAFQLGTGTVARDRDEFLEVVSMPFSEALRRARSGEISDGKTVCTLFLAQQRLSGISG